MTATAPDHDAVWAAVPDLPATQGLALLAFARATGGPGIEPSDAVGEVAAIMGQAESTVANLLRALADRGHAERVAYLDTASNGRPCARVGYRLSAALTVGGDQEAGE